MRNKFSKYFIGFRKNRNTHHSLLGPNNGSKVRVIIMDLSKAFDIVIGMLS